MAVAIEFGSQGSAASSSSVATIAGLDFKAEAADRLIAASIVLEDTDTISGVTIGGVTASVLVAALGGTNSRAAIWQAAVPTGTSGDVVVTLTSGDATVSVSTHSVTGADATPTDTDSATSVSAATLSIAALTIPSDGAGLVGYENNTGGTAVAWTGASVSHDTQVGGTRHSSAIVTAAGTNTITADGASSSQALVGVAWGPASGGATTTAVELDPASYAYTPSSLGVVTKRVVTLSPASFAYTANDLTVNVVQATTYSIELSPVSFAYSASDLNVRVSGQEADANLPTGGGRITRQKRKTLPYGWWAEADKPAEEIAQAEQALETARAEVRDTGEIAQGTIRRLDTALWFADVETKLTALEAAETKRKAQAELKAIAAELAQAKADYERALEEQDEEEAVSLLLSGSI